MKLKEIKNWIESLPERFLNFDVVNAEEGKLTEDGELLYRYDLPVTSLNICEETGEVLFMYEQPKIIKSTNVN